MENIKSIKSENKLDFTMVNTLKKRIIGNYKNRCQIRASRRNGFLDTYKYQQKNLNRSILMTG